MFNCACLRYTISVQLHQQHAVLTQLHARMTLIEQLHREEIIARDTRIQTLDNDVATRDLQIKLLTEQVQLLRAQKFGPSSEKLSPGQMRLLFNEAEALAAAVPQNEPASIVVPAHARKARGHRKALPDTLPRVEIIHDLPESEKFCPHDGSALQVIGRDTAEQLDYVPAIIRVLTQVCLKYGCKSCEQGVKTADKPAQILPKSNASPGLLAYITTVPTRDGGNGGNAGAISSPSMSMAHRCIGKKLSLPG